MHDCERFSILAGINEAARKYNTIKKLTIFILLYSIMIFVNLRLKIIVEDLHESIKIKKRKTILSCIVGVDFIILL